MKEMPVFIKRFHQQLPAAARIGYYKIAHQETIWLAALFFQRHHHSAVRGPLATIATFPELAAVFFKSILAYPRIAYQYFFTRGIIADQLAFIFHIIVVVVIITICLAEKI